MIYCSDKGIHHLWESGFKGSRKAPDWRSSLGLIFVFSFWSINDSFRTTLSVLVPVLGAGIWWSCVTVEGDLHSKWVAPNQSLGMAWGGVECGKVEKDQEVSSGLLVTSEIMEVQWDKLWWTTFVSEFSVIKGSLILFFSMCLKELRLKLSDLWKWWRHSPEPWDTFSLLSYFQVYTFG